ncbi:Conserved_hypothetical protein [Hexamita inflata]|uniref:Uncharacterized protein n=3 Tax=Hexamita inflata TaxID=28002 RepID=A0ABP1HBZ8_9EUKA
MYRRHEFKSAIMRVKQFNRYSALRRFHIIVCAINICISFCVWFANYDTGAPDLMQLDIDSQLTWLFLKTYDFNVFTISSDMPKLHHFIMSYADKALSYFRTAPHRLSCCSSVIAGVNSLEDPMVAQCSKFGGGQAPEGLCGAAHAVKLLRPDLEDVMIQRFTAEAGSVKCKEIRGLNKLPCQGCVRIASDILEGK